MTKFDDFRDSLARNDSNFRVKLRGYSRFIDVKIKEFFGDCPLDVVKLLLDHGADVNNANEDGETCLHKTLQYSNNEAIIVELLARGADVNKPDKQGDCPLKTAIVMSRGEEVIRALLDKGAHLDTLDGDRRSPLCHAFHHSSDDIIQLLLDAGPPSRSCQRHHSVLYCFVESQSTSEDILDHLILERPNDLTWFSTLKRQSLLCLALRHNAKAQFMLLLNRGASLRVCNIHNNSPLRCVAQAGVKITESVVKLLVERGVNVEEDSGAYALKIAVEYCDYEVGAIRLLLDLPGMVDCILGKNFPGLSIVHSAVKNPFRKLEALELILNRIGGCTKLNWWHHSSHTVLHDAICFRCPISIIKLLLKFDFPFNGEDFDGDTPLYLAVRSDDKYNSKWEIINELLIAGAKIVTRNKWGVIKYKLGSNSVYALKGLKILVKFIFLQNPQFNLEDCKSVLNVNKMLDGILKKKIIKQYSNDCLNELKELESIQIGDGFTLCEFARGYCLPNVHSHDNSDITTKNIESKNVLQNMSQSGLPNTDHNIGARVYNLDQVLRVMSGKKIKIYFDVLEARLGRTVMEQALVNMDVYTSKTGSDTEKIYLNEVDVLYRISTFLSNNDLFKFILAFYDPNKSKSSINNEPSTKKLKINN